MIEQDKIQKQHNEQIIFVLVKGNPDCVFEFVKGKPDGDNFIGRLIRTDNQYYIINKNDVLYMFSTSPIVRSLTFFGKKYKYDLILHKKTYDIINKSSESSEFVLF